MHLDVPSILSSPTDNISFFVEADKKGTVFARNVYLSNFNLHGRIVVHDNTHPHPTTSDGATALQMLDNATLFKFLMKCSF